MDDEFINNNNATVNGQCTNLAIFLTWYTKILRQTEMKGMGWGTKPATSQV